MIQALEQVVVVPAGAEAFVLDADFSFIGIEAKKKPQTLEFQGLAAELGIKLGI